MLFGTSNFDRQAIINSTVALAKATRVFDVPVVLTTVETKAFSGNLWPQIRAVFPGREPIERSSMNSWDDKNFVAAIGEERPQEDRDRRLVDRDLRRSADCTGHSRWLRDLCSRGLLRRRQPACTRQCDERVIQAGAVPVTSLSTMLEWQRDWAHKDTYDAVMDIVKTHYGAYGIGVEYAYTMVHGASPTKFPEYVAPVLAGSHK